MFYKKRIKTLESAVCDLQSDIIDLKRPINEKKYIGKIATYVRFNKIEKFEIKKIVCNARGNVEKLCGGTYHSDVDWNYGGYWDIRIDKEKCSIK